MNEDVRVPMKGPMVPSRRRSGRPRSAITTFAVSIVVVAISAVASAIPGVAATDPSGGTDGYVAVTPVTTPDGVADPEAQAALDETLALAPTDSPPMPDDPFVVPVQRRALEKAAMLALFEATKRSDEANLAALDAAGRADRARKAETKARLERNRRAGKLSRERKRLRSLTIRAYVNGGDIQVQGDKAMLEGDSSDPVAGRMIMFEQVLENQTASTRKAERELSRAEAVLRDRTGAREAADRELASASATAADREAERSQAERDHDRTVAEFDASVRALRQAPRGMMAPVETPLIGVPRLDAGDLTGWFEASPYGPAIPTPISDIAAWFIEEGRAEGIRGDVAFVQAVLETGGFTNGDSVERNNYSGIGHYDDLAAGWAFPSARDGVRAQIQLLKSYAVAKPHYAQDLVDVRLRGPAGCCATWGDLTRRWATDPTYGPKVMLLYTSLVDFAISRRAAGEGLDFP